MPNPGVGVVHPRLAASLNAAGHYPQRVAIQVSTATTDTLGSTTRTWATLDGHGDIPARMAPGARGIGTGTGGGTQEIRRGDGSLVTEPYRIGLARYAPTVTTAHRALVAGVAYDILTVEADAQSALTWLVVERVR